MTPANDDIKEYIRDVKEAAKQLGHGDDTVVNLLKATMPQNCMEPYMVTITYPSYALC